MSTEVFFQTCQDGDVEKLRGQLEEDASFDLNVQDVHGMTGLAYAARNGHVDIVRELLSRGATKTDLLEQGYGLNNPEIASLLGVESMQQNGAEGSGEGYAAMPVDVHGGQQMPDGTISYMNASNFGQGFQMMPPFLGAPYPPQFFPEGMHAPPAIFQPGNGIHRRGNPGHGRKESAAANLPPLEVARMIPCKYFPNCKYGDKCHFAHPQIGLPVSMPPQAHPLSPTMSHPPPMQALYYQQVPPGYPYMPYGNGPQQFIPMGPPTPLQQHQQQSQQPFGTQQHYTQPTFQPLQNDVQPMGEANEATGDQGQQQEAQSVSQNDAASPQPNGAISAGPQSGPPQPAFVAGSGSKDTEEVSPDAATSSTPAPATDNKDSSATASPQAQAAEQDGINPTSKPVHRRQSFNSFLHHHAVPFQPQGPSAGLDGVPMMNGHAFAPRNTQGAKARRLAAGNGGVGANGYPNAKRSSHSGERPPCTFFQAGRCRYGDECRFPHILVDGTDARPLHAQQRQAAAVQMAAVNGASSRTANTHSAPASAPTGPQADKRAQQQQQQPQQQQNAPAHQSQQQKEQLQQQVSSSSQPTPAQAQNHERHQAHQKSGKGNQANNVVRSNPSKTTQAATAAAGKEGGGKKQKNQNQQQGQGQLQRQSQRIPTVNDFPALASPNLNGNSTSTSPMPTPAAVAASNGNGAGSSAPAGASAAVPKVNFSAILSAPAPPKQPKVAAVEAAPEANDDSAAEKTSVENSVQGDDAADGKADAPAQQVKTHATAAAALAAGIPAANGSTNGAIKPQQANAQTNGKEKPRAQPNGIVHKEGGKSGASSPVSYRAAAAAPAPSKAAPNGAAESEDDFQLVNRSRSTNKRPSQGGSASGKSGDGYTPQVKAVAA